MEAAESEGRGRVAMPPKTRPTPARRRVVLVLLAIVALDAVACVVGAAVGGYETLALRSQLSQSGSTHLNADAQSARDRLGVAAVAFGVARASFWPWRPLADAVASIEPARVVGTVGPLLDLAADGSSAGLHAVDGMLPALSTLHANHRTAGDVGTRLLSALERGHTNLLTALTGLHRATTDWSAVDPSALPASLRARLEPLRNGLPTASDALRFAVEAPDLLGATQPRFYLLVPQNPWDLRATGGFAGTASLVEARRGLISLSATEGSSAVDPYRAGFVHPPLPLLLYPHTDNWFYRDANWSPDFPTSAALMRYFYWLGKKRMPDGVIAFDSALLGPLLHITGPITVAVPGTSTRVTLTAANGVDMLDHYVNAVGIGGRPAIPNKTFASAAYHDIFVRLRSLPTARMIDAARALGDALRQRHLLLWLPDPAVAPILARRGWDGAINPTRSDYLYVVDTNVHYNKINKRVDERISYRAAVRSDRSLFSTLAISYANEAVPTNIPPPQNNTLYEDFIRVYVPLGSRLLRVSGLTQPWPATRAYNKVVFEGYLRLPSRKHTTITFSYIVPANAVTDTNSYHLTIQKQPGTDPLPLQVEVRAIGRGVVVGGGTDWSWRGVRRTDVTLSAPLSGGHARPVPLAFDANSAVPIGPGAQIEPGVVLPTTLPQPPAR